MAKTVLLRSKYGKPNIQILYRYYLENLAETNKGKVTVRFHQGTVSRKFSLKRRVLKWWYTLCKHWKYDLVISDYYDHGLFEAGKKTMFIVHGAVFKQDPNHMAISQSLQHFRRQRSNTDYVVTLGEEDRHFFLRNKELEDIKLPEYIGLGLPRNDELFDTAHLNSVRNKIRETHDLGDDKLILYAPTYRSYDLKSLPMSREEVIELNEILKEKNTVLIYRPHYFKDIFPEEFFNDFSNIRVISPDLEPNTGALLITVDGLITDFSSIFIDYLCLDRPVAFFHFDYEDYMNMNGYNLDFSADYIPGPVLNAFPELKQYIGKLLSGDDAYNDHRSMAKSFFYSNFDGNSSQRIWSFVLDRVLNF